MGRCRSPPGEHKYPHLENTQDHGITRTEETFEPPSTRMNPLSPTGPEELPFTPPTTELPLTSPEGLQAAVSERLSTTGNVAGKLLDTSWGVAIKALPYALGFGVITWLVKKVWRGVTGKA